MNATVTKISKELLVSDSKGDNKIKQWKKVDNFLLNGRNNVLFNDLKIDIENRVKRIKSYKNDLLFSKLYTFFSLLSTNSPPMKENI